MSTTLRCRWGIGRTGWPVLLAGFLAVAFAWPCAPVRAAPEVGAEVGAEQAVGELVDEALFREIYARDQVRSRLLDQALKQSPNYAPARWHSGHVQLEDGWVKIDDVPSLARSDKQYREYLRIRPQYPDSVAGQRQLGVWCDQRRLKGQARAHFLRVLEMSPDDREARTRLGYRRVAGAWLTRDEFRQANARTRQVERNRSQWEPKLLRVHYGLQRRSEKEQEKARALCLTIDDPAAIPTIESVLSRSSEKGALLAVETLGSITDHEASLPLARQAVFSDWPKVRLAAATQLKGRPLEAFVSEMLAVMHTPVQSRDEFERRGAGSLLHRQTLSSEGRTVKQETVFETAYRGPVAWVEPAAQTISQRRQDSIAQSNARTEELNGRICSALNIATGQELTDQPEAWWKWWDDYNETLAEEKPVERTYNREVYDPPPLPPSGHSCFGAGTAVWTMEGPKPIERLRIGDLVLSQDPESGQLAYKPVLRTTVGPPLELVKVLAGSESFDCTGGHLFWVSGKGWGRARQLQAGDVLHGVTGTTAVAAVEAGPTQRAFNLVVADFNTYFVGRRKILVHDVTPRRPTASIVPGLRQ
jgi:hypothetical protein